MRILIVEDDLESAKSLKEIFETNNFSTMVANDGFEALKLMKENKFDFIVSDVNMPYMDGFSLARIIRERDKETPLILHTAMHAPSEFEEIAKRIGVNKFISNSNIRSTLKEVMERLDTAFTTNKDIAHKIITR